VVSIDRSLKKRLLFSADFDGALSCDSPFKVPHHLVHSLEIDRIIAMSHVIFIAP
jgi:hypothetical protein